MRIFQAKNSEKISGNESGDNLGKPKLTYEFVKREFDKADLELLEKTYINNNVKMKYKCKICGLEHSITYGNLSQGRGCPQRMISKFKQLLRA